MTTYNCDNAPIMAIAKVDERGHPARSLLLRLLAAAVAGPMGAFPVPALAAAWTSPAASSPNVLLSHSGVRRGVPGSTAQCS